MNILSERPLRRTSVVDSSKIRPLSVINEAKALYSITSILDDSTERTFQRNSFLTDLGCILKAHLTTELVRLANDT